MSKTTAFIRGRKAHINVTLDVDQVVELDRLADEWGNIGRSAVVRIAVGQMLRQNSTPSPMSSSSAAEAVVAEVAA